jgi:hypothetical protein
MKTNNFNLAFLLVPAIAISFLATGCVNEFMLAASSGMYDPYYGEYNEGNNLYIENNYYPEPVTTTVIRTAPTRVVYENDYRPDPPRRNPSQVDRPRQRAKGQDQRFNDGGHNKRPDYAKSNGDHNRNKRPKRQDNQKSFARDQNKSLSGAGQNQRPTKAIYSNSQNQRPAKAIKADSQNQRPTKASASDNKKAKPSASGNQTQKPKQSSSADEQVLWPRKGSRANQ